jgi:hypothetical protein
MDIEGFFKRALPQRYTRTSTKVHAGVSAKTKTDPQGSGVLASDIPPDPLKTALPHQAPHDGDKEGHGVRGASSVRSVLGHRPFDQVAGVDGRQDFQKAAVLGFE